MARSGTKPILILGGNFWIIECSDKYGVGHFGRPPVQYSVGTGRPLPMHMVHNRGPGRPILGLTLERPARLGVCEYSTLSHNGALGGKQGNGSVKRLALLSIQTFLIVVQSSVEV